MHLVWKLAICEEMSTQLVFSIPILSITKSKAISICNLLSNKGWIDCIASVNCGLSVYTVGSEWF